MRIVSLLPSATEIVASLGAAAELVGVSHECDHPPGIVGTAVLTRPRSAFPRSSAAIDRGVRALLEQALAVYEIDLEALRRAAPDVIVTQDLCEVCAVSFADVQRAAREVCAPEVELVNLSPLRLSDVRADFLRVARALGRAQRGAELAAEFDARLESLRGRCAQLRARPRVLTIEWLAPVMIGGTWMPELVELCGGQPLVTRPGDHAPTLDAAALQALDPAPDVVLVKPCGFDLERSRGELELLRELLRPLDWPACARGALWLADGNAFFNRPGPRLVESAEILAACMHPGSFPDLAARHAASFERIELT